MGSTGAAYWSLRIPDLVLMVLIYALIARMGVDLVVGHERRNGVLTALDRVTRPVVGAVGAITPRAIPTALVTLCAILWLFAARLLLLQGMMLVAMRRGGG
jgi:hypothetical protein